MMRKFTSTFLHTAATLQCCIACIFCLAFCHAAHARQLSVAELLHRYAANQDKLKSFIAKTEVITTRSPQDAPAQQARMERTMVELRYEDSGSDLAAYYWFRDFNRRHNGTWVPEDRWHSVLWDRKSYYDYYRAPVLDSSKVMVSSDEDYIKQAIGIGYSAASSILGILYGDLDRFDSILRQSDSISVRSKLERVGSVDCYVIDAKSEHGTYAVWLDPEHGYGIAKAVVHKGPEDLLHGRPPSSYIVSPGARSFFMKNVRFENVEGVWVPMEADYGLTIKEQNDTRSRHTHSKITQIDIDPNHSELQSFVLDVQNGTRVKILEAPGIRYTWQNGEIVPDIDEYVIDEIDKMAEEIMAEGVVSSEPATDKKTEISADEPVTTRDAQADTAESQPEVLSESRPFPVVVLIPIGLVIIGVIAWRVFLLKKE